MKEWAAAEGTDLKASSAYSDSYYDAPLLAGVGEPVAVNPDAPPRRPRRLRGWPVRYLDLPQGVPKFAGRELQEWGAAVARPELLPTCVSTSRASSNIPQDGPVIVVFNHRSYFDATVVGMALARPVARSGSSARRRFRRAGHRDVRPDGGRHPVEPVVGSDEPLEAAIDVLEAGEAISLTPEGTIPRGPAFFDPELKGRWGAARLAQPPARR